MKLRPPNVISTSTTSHMKAVARSDDLIAAAEAQYLPDHAGCLNGYGIATIELSRIPVELGQGKNFMRQRP